jgi:hypothetical protein
MSLTCGTVIAALAPDAMPDIDLKHLMTAGEFKALLARLVDVGSAASVKLPPSLPIVVGMAAASWYLSDVQTHWQPSGFPTPRRLRTG